MNAVNKPAAKPAARTFKMRGAPRLTRFVAAVLAIVAVFLASFILLAPTPRWHGLWPHVLGCLLVAGGGLWGQSVTARCRLTVDDRGIRLENRYRGAWGGLFMRPWAVAWTDIERVTANAGLGTVQIRRKGRGVAVRLMVRQWIPADGPDAGIQLFRSSDATRTELWHMLDAWGAFDPGRFGAGRGLSDFDLGKHPATRWALVACVLLMGYGAADLGSRPHGDYLKGSLVIGAFAAALAFMLVARARRPYPVPMGITAMLAFFVAVASTLAGWAALSRFAA
jgi:hypothetical protein